MYVAWIPSARGPFRQLRICFYMAPSLGQKSGWSSSEYFGSDTFQASWGHSVDVRQCAVAQDQEDKGQMDLDCDRSGMASAIWSGMNPDSVGKQPRVTRMPKQLLRVLVSVLCGEMEIMRPHPPTVLFKSPSFIWVNRFRSSVSQPAYLARIGLLSKYEVE